MIKYIDNYIARLKFYFEVEDVSEKTIAFFQRYSGTQEQLDDGLIVTDIGNLKTCRVDQAFRLESIFNLEYPPIVLLEKDNRIIGEYDGVLQFFNPLTGEQTIVDSLSVNELIPYLLTDIYLVDPPKPSISFIHLEK